jgi:hypothetical protein
VQPKADRALVRAEWCPVGEAVLDVPAALSAGFGRLEVMANGLAARNSIDEHHCC